MENNQKEIDNQIDIQEEKSEELSESQVEKNVNQFYHLFDNEFIHTITNFVNELDIAFDNIEKSKIKELRNYIKMLEKDNEFLKSEMKKFGESLSEYQNDLNSIIHPTKKIKKEQLQFMENLTLFNDILDFKIFSNENKNTKISIIRHINTLFMACTLNMLDGENLSFKQLLEKSTGVFNQLVSTNEKNETPSTVVKNKNNSYRKKQDDMPDLEDIGASLGGVMESLLGNKDILNLAKDLSKDIQSKNVNPMSLVSSLLSGKPDPKINKIVDSVTHALERKIESGEIDKEKLERETHKIMSSIDLQKLGNFGNIKKK